MNRTRKRAREREKDGRSDPQLVTDQEIERRKRRVHATGRREQWLPQEEGEAKASGSGGRKRRRGQRSRSHVSGRLIEMREGRRAGLTEDNKRQRSLWAGIDRQAQ